MLIGMTSGLIKYATLGTFFMRMVSVAFSKMADRITPATSLMLDILYSSSSLAFSGTIML